MKVLFALLVVVTAGLTGCSRQESRDKAAVANSDVVPAVNESNFDTEVQRGVVVVDFWATWCGPCKMQAPVVAELAEKVRGKAKVVKLDVDAAPKIAQRFDIRAIPTLLVFKDGKPHQRMVGLTKVETLLAAVTSAADSK